VRRAAAGSFALLFLVPIRPFQQLGFAVAAGLLMHYSGDGDRRGGPRTRHPHGLAQQTMRRLPPLDAFVVRTLLVPALIVLVGPVGGGLAAV